MRYVARVGMVLAVLFAGIVLPGATAQACSCAMADGAQYMNWADAAFFGQIVDKDRLLRGDAAGPTIQGKGPTIQGPTGAVYTVEVEQVYKGQVHAQQAFVASANGAACGRTFPASGGVLIYGDRVPDRGDSQGRDEPVKYSTNLCSGSYTTEIAPTGLGEGHPPIGATPALASDLTIEQDDGSSTGALVALAGGMVLLLAAALGVVVWRRRPN